MALATILGPTRHLRLVDQAMVMAPGPRATADATARSRDAGAAALVRAGCVVLALPAASRDAGAAVARRLKPSAVLVETLSVKRGPADWTALRPAVVDYLGTNPQFSPDLAWRRRTVAMVHYREGLAAALVLEPIAATGSEIVRFDARARTRPGAV